MSISHRIAVIATQTYFLLSHIIWPRLRKFESAPNDLKMTLNATRSKVPHICESTTHESQISLHFTPRSLFFQII